MEEFETKIKIKGTVTDITFRNDINGYTVFQVDTNDEELTVVGITSDLKMGDKVELVGDYVYHSVYGRQFKADFCNALLPETVEDLYHYLASGAIKGIRESTALKIVDKFGEETLNILVDIYPNRKITLARELTKIHEEFIRTTLSDCIMFNKPENLHIFTQTAITLYYGTQDPCRSSYMGFSKHCFNITLS